MDQTTPNIALTLANRLRKAAVGGSLGFAICILAAACLANPTHGDNPSTNDAALAGVPIPGCTARQD